MPLFVIWGFGAVAIGVALRDGPLACVGQANGPLSISGRFAGLVGDNRSAHSRYLPKSAVLDDCYLQKSAVYGDSYLPKSAEFGRCYFPIRALPLVNPLAGDSFIAVR